MPVHSPTPRNPAAEPEADGTLILSRSEIAALLSLDDCIAAVESALLAHAKGRTVKPAVLGSHVDAGGFHVKTAGLLDQNYFAAKLNSNFYDNGERYGLPRIQGLILLYDLRNGYPAAILDSGLITELRTAAASAVAAKHLARADATVATIYGCGLQGRVQLAALSRVRSLTRAYALDIDRSIAETFAAEMSEELGIEVSATDDLSAALRESRIIATCTPSNRPLLMAADLAPGSFVAAVGADSELKQELDPEIFRVATAVLDDLESCSHIGELHHALESGVLTSGDDLALLHEVVGGQRPGRTRDDEILVYDSTGIALQDVAAATVVLERARAAGAGTRLGIL